MQEEALNRLKWLLSKAWVVSVKEKVGHGNLGHVHRLTEKVSLPFCTPRYLHKI
ncbi:hypothetical protein NMYAN_40089 [Nitrosomonas nitrosa]|uniref:Uncharacterized protein n=1 Tax=Nitrosomonas nitrosa TaxID=52442 RepID=A0A8H9DAT0_9PROT|nr:hypothetical protein NMYAN_40089 [Nitrosomonas nitrosa]